MKKAFTLAEMLIVIAIIGVVAALVMPSLVADYQNRVLMTQLKKAYAEISQAGLLAIAQDDAGTFSSTKAYKNGTFLSTYFKKSKSCGRDYEGCISDSYTDPDGDSFDASKEFGGKSETKNSFACIKAKAGYALCLSGKHGFLDVNAQRGPNQVGKDAFTVGIGEDGTIDDKYSHSLKDIVKNDWDMSN